jgi:hypothetical protein
MVGWRPGVKEEDVADYWFFIAVIIFALVIGFAVGQKNMAVKPKCEVYTIPDFAGQWCVKHDKGGWIYYSRKNVRVYLD